MKINRQNQEKNINRNKPPNYLFTSLLELARKVFRETIYIYIWFQIYICLKVKGKDGQMREEMRYLKNLLLNNQIEILELNKIVCQTKIYWTVLREQCRQPTKKSLNKKTDE